MPVNDRGLFCNEKATDSATENKQPKGNVEKAG